MIEPAQDQSAPEQAKRTFDRRTLLWILMIFTVWRLVIHGLGMFGDVIVAPDPLGPERAARQGLEIWMQWDATYYVWIGHSGYPAPTLAVFFPLFPLAMRAGRNLLSGQLPTEQIGMLINLLIVPIALVVMHALTKHYFGEDAAKRSIVYLLLFPTAVFLAVPYTEALFLLLVISAFLSGEKEKWLVAGILGALAAATRLTGVFVLPCLALLYLTKRSWRKPGLAWMWLALIPLGLAFHAWTLDRSGYDWWLFMKASELGWPERQLSFDLIGTIARSIRDGVNATGYPGPYTPLVDLGALAFAIVLGIFVWRLLPKAYFLFVAMIFITMIATRSLISSDRYVLGMFPLFMVLGYLGRYKLLDRSYVTVGGMGLGLFTVMFVTGYWVG